nr:hypothetical protein [Tanacetum cinerariifolium]
MLAASCSAEDGAESVFVRSEGAVSRNISFDSIARFCSGTKLPSGFRYTSGYQIERRIFDVEGMGPDNVPIMLPMAKFQYQVATQLKGQAKLRFKTTTSKDVYKIVSVDSEGFEEGV